jgi:hypothetical protein
VLGPRAGLEPATLRLTAGICQLLWFDMASYNGHRISVYRLSGVGLFDTDTYCFTLRVATFLATLNDDALGRIWIASEQDLAGEVWSLTARRLARLPWPGLLPEGASAGPSTRVNARIVAGFWSRHSDLSR